MPIIEFSCQKCKNRFEELVFKNDDIGSSRCPKCGSKKLQRLFSVFGFVSKGSSKDSPTGTARSSSSCASCAKPTCAGCGN